MKINIPITGKLQDTAVDADRQCAFNMYPHSKGGYRQFPGLVQFMTAGGAASFRGAGVMGGVLYALLGTSFGSIDSSGTFSSIGTIAGSGVLVFDTDDTQLVMVNGSVKYLYTVSGGLVAITDADLGDTYSTAYLDSTFYYEVGGKIYASLLGDASSVSALDFITAESFTDDIVRLLSVNQLLYAFGSSTIEVYYTSGTGNTRIQRQSVYEHGIVGRYAVCSIDDSIYFLDANRRLSKFDGLQHQRIFISGLGEEFDSYTTVSDCIVSAYTISQENFIEITFPTEDVTWVIHEQSGEPIRRVDWNRSRSRAASYVHAYGKAIIFDHSNGKAYTFSVNTYEDDGNEMIRETYTPVINSSMLGVNVSKFVMNEIVLAVENNDGILTTDDLVVLTTDDEEPIFASDAGISVSVSLSKDGRGRGFPQTKTKTITASGNTKYSSWGQFDNAVIKIAASGDAYININQLSVDIEKAID